MARTRKRVYVFLFILLTLLVEGSVTDALHISSTVKKGPAVPLSKENDSKLMASSLFRGDAEATIPFQDDLGSVLQSKLLMIPSQILQRHSNVRNAAVSLTKASVSLFKKWWWALPFGLAVVPVYSTAVHRVLPTMPGWWPLTKMDQLLHHSSANLIMTVFLSSNIFYFVSGSYLLVRFNSRNASVLCKGFSKLGTFILTAGVVSTVFHYFQALGSFQIAEALCYLDHGVAISSILYFWHRCGKPGLAASILAGAGLVTLSVTDPISMYPWLHSTWHGLSAAAAVCWAHDGVKRHHQLEDLRFGEN